MNPLELFQEGRLRDAIQAQEGVVRSRPDEVAARLLLCEFLLFDGNLDAVRDHIHHLPVDSLEMSAYSNDYRLLLDAEDERRRSLAIGKPRFMREPTPHSLHSVEALQALRIGDWDACTEHLDRAMSLLNDIPGHVDGRAFEFARDGDDLFAHHLEVLLDGDYYWFPFDQVARLELGERVQLRDRYLVPAHLTARSGVEWQVHLPALYPGTHMHDDDEVRTGQATDWYADKHGPTRGVGQRLFTFGEEELTLLDFTLWEG